MTMTLLNDPIALAKQLMARPSVTPDDQGCQYLIANWLSKLGFVITHLPFGSVNNLWAQYGHGSPLFVFAGHTDVVPTGELGAWKYPPFSPTEADGYLYGRGSADMKGSLAAMATACYRFLNTQPNSPQGSIAWLITSDEEGPAIDGTAKVVEWLTTKGETIDYCLVGEPSSTQQLGDTIRIGRRGSLNGIVTIQGKQGHVAYPHLADNAIHRSLACLQTLVNTTWDTTTDPDFPPTQFQLSNLQAGTGATNVIPGSLTAHFNFRYSPCHTVASLQEQVIATLHAHQLTYTLEWAATPALPFKNKMGKLLAASQSAITSHTGLTPDLSTGGGTSDGRFIAPTGCELIELGPCNATIHQINERVSISELKQLASIYEQILRDLF